MSAVHQPPAARRARRAAHRRMVAGISLVEALVALGVMGFGMVGLAGIQSGLRGNADVARQRAEAVRLAQERAELSRSYSVIPVTAGVRAFDELVTLPPAQVPAGGAGSTVFTVTQSVRDAVTTRRKTVQIDIAWEDRTGQPHTVRLASAVAGAPPELAMALSLPTTDSPANRPLGRHPGVPRDAVPVAGTSTSRLDLQPLGGAAGSAWIFDNASGAVTQLCTGGVCTTYLGRFLTGFVRFSTELITPPDAGRNPGGLVGDTPPTPATLGVSVQLIAPTTDNVPCFGREVASPQAIEYFCAVPVTAPGVIPPPPPQWSGRSLITGLGGTLAASAGDVAADRFRVCRYTPTRAHTLVPPLRNVDHPRDYVDVTTPLANQNFLVIRAGNGVTANACPGTAGAPGNTFDHQPDA